jgi:hypothetical protein
MRGKVHILNCETGGTKICAAGLGSLKNTPPQFLILMVVGWVERSATQHIIVGFRLRYTQPTSEITPQNL